MGFFKSSARRWPDAIIPFEIDRLLQNIPGVASAIQGGMDMWSTACPFLTFTERIPFIHRNWIRFVWSTYKAVGSCSSPVGMQGGEQTITCSIFFQSNALIAHEIGHALGLNHEHQRPDRNNFVNFNAFIAYYLDGARPVDFRILLPPFNIPNGEYDCSSIMHYGKRTWNSIPYFEANSGCPRGIGSTSISTDDIAVITRLYT